jgi:hypothetical protein
MGTPEWNYLSDRVIIRKSKLMGINLMRIIKINLSQLPPCEWEIKKITA